MLAFIFGRAVLSQAQRSVPSSIPPGYYNAASGKTCAELKTALFNIISANTNVLTYSPEVWSAFSTTDIKRDDNNTQNVIWDMYSDNPSGPEAFYFTYGSNQCGTYTQQGECYNREHSFPQAWFGNGTYPMYSDLNHVFPTDGFVNGKHDNNPYSEVGATPTWTSTNGSKLGNNSFPGFTGVVFEPINEYKGDFARATLYMVTRYQDNIAAWKANGNADEILDGTSYPSLDSWYIKLCYKWHLQDPPSAKEITRNEAVYNLQGNRNPFIDHPEYVGLIWQCTGLLPVRLTNLNAARKGNGINISWDASDENNLLQYEIERSSNGKDFYSIAVLKSSQSNFYFATDAQLPTCNQLFYRVKMLDKDGSKQYTSIVQVGLTSRNQITIYPNPVSNQLKIISNIKFSTPASLFITDLEGRHVMEKTIQGNLSDLNLNISALPAGSYLLNIFNNNELMHNSFIKVK